MDKKTVRRYTNDVLKKFHSQFENKTHIFIQIEEDIFFHVRFLIYIYKIENEILVGLLKI